MRRLFYLALGAAVGVLVVRRLSRAAQTLTPQGLVDAAVGLGGSLRDLAVEVRVGMAEREAELRATPERDGRVEDTTTR